MVLGTEDGEYEPGEGVVALIERGKKEGKKEGFCLYDFFY